MRALTEILRRPPVAAAVLAAVGAFALGRITAGDDSREAPGPTTAERCPEPIATIAATPTPEPVPCAVRQAPEAPRPKTESPSMVGSFAAAPALSAERVADTEREAAARLDGMAATFQTRCRWSRPAQLTVQIAFDAEGREVGRAFSADKDAPPEGGIVDCLRSVDGVSLTVRPPGAPVTVLVPFAMR